MILDICTFGKYFTVDHFIKRWRGNYSIKTVAVLCVPMFFHYFCPGTNLVLYLLTNPFSFFNFERNLTVLFSLTELSTACSLSFAILRRRSTDTSWAHLPPLLSTVHLMPAYLLIGSRIILKQACGPSRPALLGISTGTIITPFAPVASLSRESTNVSTFPIQFWSTRKCRGQRAAIWCTRQ